MPRLITIPLNIPAIIADYARRYLRSASDHETLDGYAEQTALDLKMPEAAQWVKAEIQRQKTEDRKQNDKHRDNRSLALRRML